MGVGGILGVLFEVIGLVFGRGVGVRRVWSLGCLRCSGLEGGLKVAILVLILRFRGNHGKVSTRPSSTQQEIRQRNGPAKTTPLAWNRLVSTNVDPVALAHHAPNVSLNATIRPRTAAKPLIQIPPMKPSNFLAEKPETALNPKP